MFCKRKACGSSQFAIAWLVNPTKSFPHHHSNDLTHDPTHDLAHDLAHSYTHNRTQSHPCSIRQSGQKTQESVTVGVRIRPLVTNEDWEMRMMHEGKLKEVSYVPE